MTALAADLEKASVAPAELAAVTGIAPEQITLYVAGDAEPTSNDAYAIRRALDGSYRAELAIDYVRRMQTLPLRGSDDPALQGVEPPPYAGGYTGATGGQPS